MPCRGLSQRDGDDCVCDATPRAESRRSVFGRAKSPVIGVDPAQHAFVVQPVGVGGEIGERTSGRGRGTVEGGVRKGIDLAVSGEGGPCVE